MAVQGIVSVVDDPNSGAIPDPTLLQKLAELSPAPNHLAVRCSVSADTSNGQIDMDALIASLTNYKNGGYDVWLVMHGGIEMRYQDKSLTPQEYLMYMPNASLGWKASTDPKALWGVQDTKAGDMLMNDYINKYSLRVVSILQQLFKAGVCPNNIFIWNESAQNGDTLAPGTKPSKGSSLAPAVWAAQLATTSKRIADPASGLPAINIYPGSLSCLVKYNTDPAGDFVGKYIKEALDYMDTCGVNAPYNFHGLVLNIEGFPSDKYMEDCASTMTGLLNDYKIGGQVILGEYGVQISSINNQDMMPILQSADKRFGVVFFMSFLTIKPDDTTGYGCVTYSINPQGKIVPTGETWWFNEFKNFQATLHPISATGAKTNG